ncbi:MAG: dienelactone hydrolase family protein [Rhodopseudomonas sp.]|uniref:dienelactone hydrolase family protein n=1 Tax=Rhodopseudomonas sp. TaxID=1078 RepID=UPI0017A65142|nr:dienelactone hydrolase family protein [Rhodopseudomonas sp.]NVN85137.1 dienelactone hydrolase family protein [Rhodopseudomonas sp.]
MRLLSILTSAALFAVSHAASASSLPAPIVVEIPRADGVLHATLYKPDGDGPFQAVIALHGCGGLAARLEPIQPRYADWAEQLLKTGRAVLLPDSYASRELGPQCRVKDRRVLARRERVTDILASRQWLAKQSWVAPDRISLLGWGNGASAVLWAVRPQLAIGKREPDFHTAVVFYPDCRLSSGLGWSARVPTLLMIGGNDDISSPVACRQMIDGARGRSALARIVVYPGAYQDFDRADLPLGMISAASDGPDHGHLGSDPVARDDAQKRVVKWLGR